MDNFLLIALTEPSSPLPPEREADCITRLLRSGAIDFMHLRKPSDPARVETLLELLPQDLHPRLRVHRFPELARRYGCPYHAADGEPAPDGLDTTRSCHSLEGVQSAGGCAYAFLSPLFDSISKQGYRAAFAPAELVGKLPPNAVALGGITPERLPQVARLGFRGAAMLGAIWEQTADLDRLTARLLRARRMVEGFRLQFITSAPDAEQTALQARQALEGGCRWMQVRMKDAPDSEVEQAVRLIAPYAKESGAILLVDDRVELAARMPEIDGVHLGHADMPREQARLLLGADKIIGSTANTPEQALRLAPVSDYLGVGPFRFTTTKKNLAPVLGAEGLREVSQALLKAGELLPVVAIGGILPADVRRVMESGVQGVAVSGAIHAAPSPQEATREFLNELN